MKFHVIAGPDGELLTWIKAARATDSGPRLIVIPENPTHVLYENVEVDEGTDDRATLVAALQKAVADRGSVEGRRFRVCYSSDEASCTRALLSSTDRLLRPSASRRSSVWPHHFPTTMVATLLPIRFVTAIASPMKR